jgi:prevent-host-death family protein
VKTKTVREFRSNFAALLASDESVLVTRHGKPAALVLSLKDPQKIPPEIRRQLFLAMTKDLAKQLRTGKVTEEKIQSDFESHKKRRRR